MAYKIKGDLEVARGLGFGSMTTTQRNAYTPAAAGYVVYDSDLGEVFEWNGTKWVSLVGGLVKRGVITADGDAGEGIYNLDATGAAFTFTLSAATGTQERRILIGQAVATNNVTVKVAVGDSLNGTTDGTQVISTDGSIWYAVDVATGKWEIYQGNKASSADRVFETITQATHGFGLKDVVYHNGTQWVKAQANLDASTAQAVVTAIPDVNTFEITTHGVVTLTAHGLTVGNYYWLSQTVAGLAVTAQPTSGISQQLFHVRDANTIFVDVEQPISVSAAATTNSPLGRVSARQATAGVLIAGAGYAKFDTIDSVTGIAQTISADGLVTLEAGKTYRISAGIRLKAPGIQGVQTWYMKRSTDATRIGGELEVFSNNITTNNAILPSLEFIVTITGTTAGTYGLWKDAASNLDDFGVGSYLVVEEVPASQVIPSAAITVADQTATGYFDIGTMRIQWGTNTQGVGTRSVTLPASFSTTTYAISVTPTGIANATGNISFTENTASRTTTSFGGELVYTGGITAQAGENFTWIAIGPK